MTTITNDTHLKLNTSVSSTRYITIISDVLYTENCRTKWQHERSSSVAGQEQHWKEKQHLGYDQVLESERNVLPSKILSLCPLASQVFVEELCEMSSIPL